MSLKIKIILIAITIIAVITSIICLFIYIGSLNNDISDLNVIITEQRNEIQSLHCQMDSLEKDVDSMHETINITNDFISNIEIIHETEDSIKEDIYDEVMNNEESQDWYNTPISPGILDILMNNTSGEMCVD